MCTLRSYTQRSRWQLDAWELCAVADQGTPSDPRSSVLSLLPSLASISSAFNTSAFRLPPATAPPYLVDYGPHSQSLPHEAGYGVNAELPKANRGNWTLLNCDSSDHRNRPLRKVLNPLVKGTEPGKCLFLRGLARGAPALRKVLNLLLLWKMGSLKKVLNLRHWKNNKPEKCHDLHGTSGTAPKSAHPRVHPAWIWSACRTIAGLLV